MISITNCFVSADRHLQSERMLVTFELKLSQENYITLELRKIKYIWKNVKNILAAGVIAIITLWHLGLELSSKYCANSNPE